MIIFDVQIWQVLQFVAAILFPVLVGLVTTRATDPGVKAILLLALNLVAGLLLELVDALQNGTEYNLGLALLTALGSFVVGVALHYGLWKPTGVAGKAAVSGRHVKEPEMHPVEVWDNPPTTNPQADPAAPRPPSERRDYYGDGPGISER